MQRLCGDGSLTHLNVRGEVHMVDISNKPATGRRAVAEGVLLVSPEVLARVTRGEVAKGDVLAVARVAAIMAAKRTPDWIPLCHPVHLTAVSVEITPQADGLRIQVEASTTGPTGVEMEALTAVSAGLLTLYDMLKGIDRSMTMNNIRLIEKSGGQSGHFRARG